MLLGCLLEEVPDFAWASKVLVGAVRSKGEHKENNENNNSMCVVSQKGRLDATKH